MGLFIRAAAVFLLHFPVQLKDRNKRLLGKEFSSQKAVKARQFRPAQKEESPAPAAHTLSRLQHDAVRMFLTLDGSLLIMMKYALLLQAYL